MELKDIAQEKGLRRIEAHYAHAFDPTFQLAQAILLRALEGVDVYYDRPPADGHLDSATRMGKMYVHPFPFHAVMVYDDSKDHAFIHEVDDLQYLAAVNMTPAAIAKRELREVFRAFAVCGSLVRHHYEEDRYFKVPDGTHQETSTDSEGNTTTRTVQDFSTILVHLTFNAGRIAIASEDDSNLWSAGFAPSLTYHDGHGSAIKPRTGEVFHATNEAASLGSEQLGYSAGHGDFTLTGGTRIAMIIDENGALLATGRATWRREVVQYRQDLAAKRVATEATLSSAFYLYVYQNDTATRAQIERFFPVCEARGHLAALPVQHKEGLDFAFGRMAFARSGPCAGFWCLFWCDLWACNKTLPEFVAAAVLLDPAKPGTLAYRPMPRAELEPLLAAEGLWKPAPSKDWVNSAILDLLYDSVARAGAGAIPVMPTLMPITTIGAPVVVASAGAPTAPLNKVVPT